ncbi:MAG TPA: hypothetical protein VMS17_14480 [Gemmataceae bacterium]|nr:hypothetical protein [Gemmataceae bacterium]
MNARQQAFLRQALSDWDMYSNLAGRRASIGGKTLAWLRRTLRLPAGPRDWQAKPVCHSLHYLQMATEKLAKAYFTTLPKKHLGLMKLLTALSTNAKAVRHLGFASLADLDAWVTSAAAVGDAVEKLAPALAGAGPNAEYPWPPGAELTAPVDHPFQVEFFTKLTAQAASGQPPFLEVVERMTATLGSWCQ